MALFFYSDSAITTSSIMINPIIAAIMAMVLDQFAVRLIHKYAARLWHLALIKNRLISF